MKIDFRNSYFISILIIGLFFFVFCTFAQNLDVQWPYSPVSRKTLTISTTLPELIQYFYEWLITLGGLATFISLVIGGFQYLTSMGEPTRLKEAKDRIKSAFLGLVLLLGSWLILNTINPQLTNPRLPPELGGEPFKCKTDEDCNKNLERYYKCENGVCVFKYEPKKYNTCTHAILYSQTNWQGNQKILNLNNTQEIGFTPLSVRAFVDKNNNNQYDAGIDLNCCPTNSQEEELLYSNGFYFGCNCFLNAYAGGWFLGWGCGDMEGVVSACERNIGNLIDKEIKCAKLTGTSW